MKKNFIFLVAMIMLCVSVLPVFAVNQSCGGITPALTPTDSAFAIFAKKLGTDYKSAPTPPAVAGKTLLVVLGMKLYKLNAETGEEISSTKMEGTTLYATIAPLYAEGKVFIPLDGGIVQAFDFESMKSLWVYKDSLGGQALCPVTYDNGYIYTGFWNGETEYASYVCIDTKDKDPQNETESKAAKWTYKDSGGFYWSGCTVNGNYIVFGKDDGQKGSEGRSEIIALNKNTGERVSALSVEGDIRSSIAYSTETNAFYTSSKSGYVYKFGMDSSTGKLGSLKSYAAPGSVTATPVVYAGRLYVGCQNGTTGKFIVLDAATMEEIYSVDMTGYPQASVLVSTGYEKETGKIYIYSTYNAKPGGITVFEDEAGQTQAVKRELFSPGGDMSQYCISTVAVGDDGTLYYKNDSGCIFAVNNPSAGNGQSAFEIIIAAIIKWIEIILNLIMQIGVNL